MIKGDTLKRAGIDFDSNMSRFMNDANLYEMVLTAFLRENVLEQAAEAYQSRDHHKLRDVIHESKGTSGNAGLSALYTEACSLLMLLKSEKYTEEELEEKFKKYTKEYEKARNAVKEALTAQ